MFVEFCLISFLLSEINLFRLINTQKYSRILINSDDSVDLYDKELLCIKLPKNEIVQNCITKFRIITFVYFTIKLGKIELSTKSYGKIFIIISDIEDFINKTIYKNIVYEKRI